MEQVLCGLDQTSHNDCRDKGRTNLPSHQHWAGGRNPSACTHPPLPATATSIAQCESQGIVCQSSINWAISHELTNKAGHGLMQSQSARFEGHHEISVVTTAGLAPKTCDPNLKMQQS